MLPGVEHLEVVAPIPVGPATRYFSICSGQTGEVAYKCDERRLWRFHLSHALSQRALGALTIPGAVAFFDRASNQLLAIGYPHHRDPQTFLVGERLGTIVDAGGGVRQTGDPLGEMLELQLPFLIDRLPPTIRVRFEVSFHHRDRLASHCRPHIGFSADAFHVDLACDAHSGQVVKARVLQLSRHTRDVVCAVPLEGFPIPWPDAPSPPIADGRQESPRAVKVEIERPAPVVFASPPVSRAGIVAPTPRQTEAERKPDDQRAPEPEASDAAPPSTRQLSSTAAFDLIDRETQPERRWAMILENLRLKHARRTYEFLIRYGDEISARTASWSLTTIWEYFHEQAGPSLLCLVGQYTADKALAVAHTSRHGETILQWLRERELERLLQHAPTEPPQTRAAALALLNVDPNADAKAIREVWQRLLSWLSAEGGHVPGSPIMKRRDAVAAALHVARDILLGK